MTFEHFAIVVTLIGCGLVQACGGIIVLSWLSRHEENSKPNTKNSKLP